MSVRVEWEMGHKLMKLASAMLLWATLYVQSRLSDLSKRKQDVVIDRLGS